MNIATKRYSHKQFGTCVYKRGRQDRHFALMTLIFLIVVCSGGLSFSEQLTITSINPQTNSPSGFNQGSFSDSAFSQNTPKILATDSSSRSAVRSDFETNRFLLRQVEDLKKEVEEERAVRTQEVISSADRDISTAHAILGWSEAFAVVLTFTLTIVLGIAAFFGFEARKLKGTLLDAQKAQAEIMTLKSQLSELKNKFEKDTGNFLDAAYDFFMGQACYKEDNFPDAIKYFKRVGHYRQNDPELLTDLACCYIGRENEAKALSSIQAARELDPENTDILTKIALTFRYKGNYQMAYEYIQEALKIKPNDCDIFNYQGLLLRDMEHFREAIEAHTNAKNAKQSRPETFFYLSLLYAHQGDTDQSKTMIHKARSALKYQETVPDADSPREVWRQLMVLCDSIINENVSAAQSSTKELKRHLAVPRTRKTALGHLAFLKQSLKDQALITEIINTLKE